MLNSRMCVCKNIIIIVVVLISILCNVACQSRKIEEKQSVCSYVCSNESKVISDDFEIFYSEVSTNDNLESFTKIFNQQDATLYESQNVAIGLLSKENDYILFVEDDLEKEEVKLLNINTGNTKTVLSSIDTEKFDFLLYKQNIYYLEREKNGCNIYRMSLEGKIVSQITFESSKCKLLGIVDDRIYYAFSEVESNLYINQNYVIESCDLNGENKNTILTSQQVGLERIVSVLGMRARGNNLYFLLQGKKDDHIVCVEKDTLVCKDIAQGRINDFDLDKNNDIYYTDCANIYRLELETLNDEIFLKKPTMDLTCNDEWVYFEKPLDCEGTAVYRTKKSVEGFENLMGKHNSNILVPVDGFDAWGAPIVENEDYIFSVDEGRIRRYNKRSYTSKIIHSIDNKDENRLYLNDNKLYYINYKEIGMIDFDGNFIKTIIDRNGIGKFSKSIGGFEYLDLWGIQIYNENVYILTMGFDVYYLEESGKLNKLAEDARSSCFFENKLYLTHRYKYACEIECVDLNTLESSVYRKFDINGFYRFSDVFVCQGKLCYTVNGKLVYKTAPDGEDEIVETFSKYKEVFHVPAKDDNYFICDKVGGKGSVLVVLEDETVREVLELPKDYTLLYEAMSGNYYRTVEVDNH